jgi:ribosomal protein S18 acetylase RimI-like enzyme
MREVERRLRSKGCLKVNLHVASANRRVRDFYTGIGYTQAPLLFMEKWLRT